MKQKVDENRKQKGSTHLVTFVPRILAFELVRLPSLSCQGLLEPFGHCLLESR